MEEINCKKVFSNLIIRLKQLKPELENISKMFIEISKSLNDIIEIGNINECFTENLKSKLGKLVIHLNKISKEINVNNSINLINEIIEEIEKY